MSLLTDLRRAARSLVRSPGLTVTLVITIAVGAGSTATLFSFIGGLLAHGLPDAGPAEARRFAGVATLLLFACGLILLIAGATVTGLLLSRASSRMLETAVKVALGASRARIARQLALESLLVSGLGGTAGVVCAWWTSRLVPLLFFADDAEHLAMAPQLGLVVGAGLAWVVVMAVCGLVPVLTVPHRTPSIVLTREASRGSTRTQWFRTQLVIAQIALCALIVTMAGVIDADLRAALRTSRGQALGSLLVARVQAAAGPTDRQGLQYFRALEERVRKTNGVADVALVRTLPAGRGAEQEFALERPTTEWHDIEVDVATFSPEALPVEALRPAAGRLFGGRDGPRTCRVAVINASAADEHFAGDAVGRVVEEGAGAAVQIVGVLRPADVGPLRPDSPPTLLYYDQQNSIAEGVLSNQLFRMPRTTPRPKVTLNVNVVSREYFGVFADAPVAGRAFSAADLDGACRVGVVSEEAARSIFGGQAVGSALTDPLGDRIEIVGVVRAEALGVAQRSAAPMLFLPLDQAYLHQMVLAVRAEDPTPQLLAALESNLRAVDGGGLLSPLDTLEAHLIRTSLAPERIVRSLVAVCAVLAVVLSIAGVYAVMADLVVRRRRELALRIALGAGPVRLVRSVVREGMRLAVAGAVIGLVAAMAGAPLLERVVVRPRLPGPLAILTACLTVTLLVALACAIPAWRAVSVDPRTAMEE